MRIDCYVAEKCGSKDILQKNIVEALKLEGIEAEVKILVIDDTKADALGLKNSPSVFINGKEIQPIGITVFS